MKDSSNRRAVMFVLCSIDGVVLYADPRLLPAYRTGSVIGPPNRLAAKPEGVSTIHTIHGPIDFLRVETEHFTGHIGMMCNEMLRNSAIRTLEELNHELEAIFESSLDGLVVADESGRFIRMNSSYERITGNRRNDILGETAQSIVHKGYVSDSVTLRVLESGQPRTINQTSRAGRQSVVTGNPVFDSKGKLIRVVANVRDMTEINRLKQELAESKQKLDRYSQIVETLCHEKMAEEMLVFRSRKMAAVRDSAVKFAKVDALLLITGESGVGKEVVADLIWRNSPRKGHPFLKINCGAIPENLLETELFGYEGGAFTSAKKEGQAGLFETANGGTVLLDEIGELSLALQVKLLRFAQQKEFFRVGGKKVIKVDVRVIAATNRDLQEMVDLKQFRADLFFRLNVLKINIPPLRDRPEDIIPLTSYMLGRFNKKYELSKRIARDVYRHFVDHQWPGNVRELEHLVERLVLVCDRDEISPDDLPEEMITAESRRNGDTPDKEQSFKAAKEEFESVFFRRALERYRSSRHAAEKVGVSHVTILKKAARYGLPLLPRTADMTSLPIRHKR